MYICTPNFLGASDYVTSCLIVLTLNLDLILKVRIFIVCKYNGNYELEL